MTDTENRGPGEPATRLWFETALLPEGWADGVLIELRGGTIRALQTGVARDPAAAAFGAAIPGLPNLHSHAFQRGLAGLGESRGEGAESFWTWREAMYRFVERLGPDDLEAIAALAYVEMLEAGFTRVGEFHYLHHGPDGTPYDNPAEMSGRIAAAAEASGIGLTLLPVFYAHAGFGGLPPGPSQRHFVHNLNTFQRLLDEASKQVASLSEAVLGLAPHSLRAVTAAELAALADLGAGRPIHIHVAEQRKEVDDCLAWTGRRPVEWLMSEMEIGEGWCLVHATHTTATELAAIARSGAVVGLCPITEANLGDGIFPGRRFMELGGRYGIGSDSNVRIDAAEELRTLEYGQRLAEQSRNVMAGGPGASTGVALFDASVAGGARALGVCAGLAVGQSADIVALDLAHPNLIGRRGDALLDAWIFGGPRAVAQVWRHGRLVVSDGRHRARDRIVARYRTVMTRLLA